MERLRHENKWDDARVERLKNLWADGRSCSQIADALNNEFGSSYGRNAVVGKVHRLGLSARQRPVGGKSGRPRKNRGGEARALLSSIVAKAIDIPIREFDVAIPMSQRRTMATLNYGECKWPVGDPMTEDFFFCGGEAVQERPYCAYHCRIAYQPSRRRPPDVRPFRRAA